MTGSTLDFGVLAPVLWVSGGAMLVLLGEALLAGRKTLFGAPLTPARLGSLLALISALALAPALGSALQAFGLGDARLFDAASPLYQADPFSSFTSAIVLLGALLSCLLAVGFLDELGIHHGEFYALLLLSVAGMLLMLCAVDLIALFVGLELMSIPIYVLAGFDRGRLRSNEAALKYFLMGSFASAILLYGMALLYGASGSTAFSALPEALDGGSLLAQLGLALVLVGFAFKISAVPFHQWTPDVYEGSPAVVTAFMSVTVKATAVAALMRFVALGLGGVGESLEQVLWVLAAATMLVGNLMALIQQNVKRLLAYSSIAHAGYLLLGVLTGTIDGFAAVVFYLVAYTLMNLGAFAVVIALAHRGEEFEQIEAFAGLARKRPTLSAALTLFLLSLAGIPPTLGFFAKFRLFAAAVDAGQVVLAIVGVLASVVSVYYYLRIPVLMYMRESDEPVRSESSSGELLVIAFCAAAVIVLGLWPNSPPGLEALRLADWARDAVRLFFTG